MSLAEINSFLNDFQFNKSPKLQMRRDDIKKIVQLINLKNKTKSNQSSQLSNLDLQGFIDFIL